jgi:hypothetical protein
MTTTDDSMARYTKSETATFTFIGRAESDTGADLLDKVEECLIGLNLSRNRAGRGSRTAKQLPATLWSCSAPASLTSSRLRRTSTM